MKIFKIKNFLFLTLFFGSSVVAEPSMCLTDFQEKIHEGSLKKVKSMRVKAAKHCLECGTLECKLKEWDDANKTNITICNRLFCKPIKTLKNKTLFASTENYSKGISGAYFTYSIDTSGRIIDVEIKDHFGTMDKKMALSYVKDNLKTLGYEPLEIDGSLYSLTDLHGYTTWNIVERGE